MTFAKLRECIAQRRCYVWLKDHPITGWYVAAVVTADFALHLLERGHLL